MKPKVLLADCARCGNPKFQRCACPICGCTDNRYATLRERAV